MGSIKINKKAAEKLIKEGYTVKLLPCNIRLASLWFEPSRCNTEMLNDYGTTFEKFSNEYHRLFNIYRKGGEQK